MYRRNEKQGNTWITFHFILYILNIPDAVGSKALIASSVFILHEEEEEEVGAVSASIAAVGGVRSMVLVFGNIPDDDDDDDGAKECCGCCKSPKRKADTVNTPTRVNPRCV